MDEKQHKDTSQKRNEESRWDDLEGSEDIEMGWRGGGQEGAVAERGRKAMERRGKGSTKNGGGKAKERRGVQPLKWSVGGLTQARAKGFMTVRILLMTVFHLVFMYSAHRYALTGAHAYPSRMHQKTTQE